MRVQVNVEMDPESEVEARAAMQAAGLTCVGWYHSHPSFKPIPSVIDISNQLNYQRLCEEATGVQPFVGAIVSPYDLDSTPSPRSAGTSCTAQTGRRRRR